MNGKIKYVTWFLGIVLCSSCANMVSPTGGPKDVTPPKVTKSIPENNSVLFNGNRIEINEDDNYILAPQIGAGEKDENNRFTGIVMGAAKDYNATQKQKNVQEEDIYEMLGLLGYSHGKQSI